MLRSILRWSAGTIGVLALIVVVYAMSLQPHAPPLRGDVDSDFAGGVATLERVTLNGVPQWISVRGRSARLPILLYLSGGPCGSEMARMRHYHAVLERYFLVVNWDHRSAGKSYSVANWDRLALSDLGHRRWRAHRYAVGAIGP